MDRWWVTHEDDRPEKDGALPSPFQVSGETLHVQHEEDRLANVVVSDTTQTSPART